MAQELAGTWAFKPPHRTSKKFKVLKSCPIPSPKVIHTEVANLEQTAIPQCSRTRMAIHTRWPSVLTSRRFWQINQSQHKHKQSQHWQLWPGRNTLPASLSSPSPLFLGALKSLPLQENPGVLSQKSPKTLLRSLQTEPTHGVGSLSPKIPGFQPNLRRIPQTAKSIDPRRKLPQIRRDKLAGIKVEGPPLFFVDSLQFCSGKMIKLGFAQEWNREAHPTANSISGTIVKDSANKTGISSMYVLTYLIMSCTHSLTLSWHVMYSLFHFILACHELTPFSGFPYRWRVRLCPYADICCWDGCANRCLNFTPPDSVFFREGYGILVD